jgi:co-chaperonin GroES (HSP10)
MTTFRPLNSFIQVAPFGDTQPASRLIVSVTQAAPTRGRVIAMGPGKLKEDLSFAPMPNIQVGDIVAFTTGSLQAVKSSEGTVFLIEAETLLGVEA